MKKLLVTILAFTYLAVSSGASLNLHYCMGKLVSWDLSHPQKSKKCDNCGMDKADHNGCCKDQHKVFQIDKDQKTVEATFHLLSVFSDIIIPVYGHLPGLHTSSIAVKNPSAHAPPLPGPIPIFLLHCHFRI